jgi:integrase
MKSIISLAIFLDFSGFGFIIRGSSFGEQEEEYHGQWLRLRIARFMEDAIKENKQLADVTWHVFRHTYISRLVMAGVDLRTVQELAGHKDISMTTRYAHLSPDHKLSAVAKLSSFREQSELARQGA